MTDVVWDDPDAVALRAVMDAELAERYPQFGFDRADAIRGSLVVDPSDVLVTALVRDAAGEAVGHAALRTHDGDHEVKRVIVRGDQRGRGVARLLMDRVERAAREAGAARVVLHTGHNQPEAVALYRRLGYTPIPLYEPYATVMPESFCFEKLLDPA
ncbi:GNAT family N-acetyltransferase [Nakamurella deserti]|uniref:GNAT family N-acetyltransferase n=1 Tax=Nakamurella deserti TaxID=2164074 RepID=UPI00197C780A|nr:GNAT family N-acetyltransferase [Nakamurella deserti]